LSVAEQCHQFVLRDSRGHGRVDDTSDGVHERRRHPLPNTLTSVVTLRRYYTLAGLTAERGLRDRTTARTRVADVGTGWSGGKAADLRCERSMQSCESL
jgi:hypothetical protein